MPGETDESSSEGGTVSATFGIVFDEGCNGFFDGGNVGFVG
jgi:hypothetical protein